MENHGYPFGKPEQEHWDTVFASHTFHEIRMYYPMRVVRDKEYKLIWNIAHPLPYPFASDLWAAPVFRLSTENQWRSLRAKNGTRLHSPPGIRVLQDRHYQDPHEAKNLSGEAEHAEALERYKKKLKAQQQTFHDPWVMKWSYE